MDCRPALARRLTRLVAACAAVVGLSLPAVVAPASASVPAGMDAADGVVFKVREGESSSSVASTAGGRVVRTLERGRAHMRLDKGASLGTVLGKLQRDPRVEWAEPNARYKASVQPSDPCLTSSCPGTGTAQWAPAAVAAPQAWDVTKGSAAVRVAVIDGGVEASHPQLDGKVVTGPDFTGEPADSCAQHGTHVAGTIAARTDDGQGVAGLGWDTRVLSIRVLSDPAQGCSGLSTWIAAGIDHAVANGAKVVNLSLAGTFDSRTIRESVQAAVRAGVVVVAAAGNEAVDELGQPWNPVEYPAAYPEVLSVSATTRDDRRASFANHGSWVDVAAPGVHIVSTMPGGGYGVMSGTSMATPHVAAAAALVFAHDPAVNGYDVVSRIQLGADAVPGSGTEFRFGRLNMYKALVTQGPGYYMVASDGGIFSFGERFFGSTGHLRLNQPVFAMAATPRRAGYWFVARDGGIFSFGDAGYFGSMGGKPLSALIVGMAATPSGKGYWLAGADGAVHAFGDAKHHGGLTGQRLPAPIVAMAPTASGQGYWLAGADGSVYQFGDAGLFGSMRGTPLNRPVVGMATTATGRGYWMVATDGGIFAFGDADFHGATGHLRLNQPIVGMRAAPSGDGYWLVASDGGIFAFNVPFLGSMGSTRLNQPVVGMG